jgi:adenylate kinase family enzyme
VHRIVILGRAGTGKTTLARRLGEITGAPVIILDDIWQQHWTEANVPEFRSLIEEAHKDDNWISDGNFAIATFDIRLPRATLILWLDSPKLVCSWRAIVRVFKRGERHRVSGLIKVLRFIWKFDWINRPRIEAARLAHGPSVPVQRLNGRGDVEAFLASLRKDT